MDVDVVVVGAGVAGLVAATDLAAAGLDVAVFEARDRVGGRVLDRPLGSGAVLELGGQWVGPTQHHVGALVRSLGLHTFPTHSTGDHVWEHDGSVHRYRSSIPDTDPVALADHARIIGALDRLARRVPTDAPWTAPRARDHDAQTFESWLRRTGRTPLGRDLVRLALEGIWAVEAGEPSLLHVLFTIASAGSMAALIDTEGGSQDARIVGGPAQIPRRLAAALGDRVVLGAPVRRLVQRDGHVHVVADGHAVRARRVIVAAPPPVAQHIDLDPAPGQRRDGLAQRMAMGSVIKCLAIYDEPFWRADGLSGQAVSLPGPVRLVYDNSPPGGSPGVLVGFLEAGAARAAADRSPVERCSLLTAVLARLFGDRAAAPVDYVDHVWAHEPWTRGGYMGYLPPGGWTGFGAALREPVGLVHWAGTETATEWYGYLDGAVSSGRRAAAEVAAALGC